MFIPKARPHTSKFFTLSYYNSESGKYAIGSNDYHFISFCIILFTGLRAGFMEHLLAPLARQWGISKRKEITRFSEQAWMLIYYSFFWSLGTVRHILFIFPSYTIFRPGNPIGLISSSTYTFNLPTF